MDLVYKVTQMKLSSNDTGIETSSSTSRSSKNRFRKWQLMFGANDLNTQIYFLLV